uniref:Ig-like domain-containing protein n=1 Tax=Legionella sp. W05-934-2 TaxID=1198649 RepID=UPI003462B068
MADFSKYGIIETVNGILIRTDVEGHSRMLKQGAELRPEDTLVLLSGNATIHLDHQLPYALPLDYPYPLEGHTPIFENKQAKTLAEIIQEEAWAQGTDISDILDILEETAAGDSELGSGGNFYVYQPLYTAGSVSVELMGRDPNYYQHAQESPLQVFFYDRSAADVGEETRIVDNSTPVPTLSLNNFIDTGISGTDFISQDNTFELSTSGQEAGASIRYELSSDGGTTWSATTANQTGLADGDYQFRSTVTDAAGNSAISNTISVIVDTTAPVPTLSINDVTADNIINAQESGGTVTITGSAGGDAQAGDTVTLTINGTDYTGTLDGSLQFAIDVAGSELVADGDSQIDGSITTYDLAGNPGTATSTQSYTVDTTASASISVDTITPDDIVNAAEAAGTINVTGSVGGDATVGDTISFSVN